jgi:transcriptional regulator with XRE-family HTH domain
MQLSHQLSDSVKSESSINVSSTIREVSNMDTTECFMLAPTDTDDKLASMLGYSHKRPSFNLYWKCKIGRRIRLAREKLSRNQTAAQDILLQEELADLIGIPTRSFWEVENGLLALDGPEIARIADALNIHPGWLFDDGSWEDWAQTSLKGTPSWLLAKTIGELSQTDRDVLEKIVIHLNSRPTQQSS